uniref:Uncharacterized protein n=1 Tax=Trichuris muris TaxID=70415 RepID=A0A5S6QX26_TRIMR
MIHRPVTKKPASSICVPTCVPSVSSRHRSRSPEISYERSVESLVDRTINICDAEYLDEDISHITISYRSHSFYHSGKAKSKNYLT